MIRIYRFSPAIYDEITEYLQKMVSSEGIRWWTESIISPNEFCYVYKLWVEFTEEEELDGTADKLNMILSLKTSN